MEAAPVDQAQTQKDLEVELLIFEPGSSYLQELLLPAAAEQGVPALAPGED
jgi:hypothetical protein